MTWGDMLDAQKAEINPSRYYTRYIAQGLTSSHDGTVTRRPDGAPMLCQFGDSNTILGVRIGGKVLLTRDEAEYQCELWSKPADTGTCRESGHVYRVYDRWEKDEVELELGRTPVFPGMGDEMIRPRTPASPWHVVGEGGTCWCQELHEDYGPS